MLVKHWPLFADFINLGASSKTNDRVVNHDSSRVVNLSRNVFPVCWKEAQHCMVLNFPFIEFKLSFPVGGLNQYPVPRIIQVSVLFFIGEWNDDIFSLVVSVLCHWEVLFKHKPAAPSTRHSSITLYVGLLGFPETKAQLSGRLMRLCLKRDIIRLIANLGATYFLICNLRHHFLSLFF